MFRFQCFDHGKILQQVKKAVCHHVMAKSNPTRCFKVLVLWHGEILQQVKQWVIMLQKTLLTIECHTGPNHPVQPIPYHTSLAPIQCLIPYQHSVHHLVLYRIAYWYYIKMVPVQDPVLRANFTPNKSKKKNLTIIFTSHLAKNSSPMLLVVAHNPSLGELPETLQYDVEMPCNHNLVYD